jgi:DNA-directed RNA polymerase subunit RPC12/RpoP
MGCCGKRRKAGDRSLEPARKGPLVSNRVPKGAAVRELPLTRSAPASDAGPGYTVEKNAGGSCPTCGTRLVLKNRYSERLRRYFAVSWCSTCKEPR